MNQLQVGTRTLNVEMTPTERRWGRGVFVKLLDVAGKIVGTIEFGIHPEFDDYDYYQRLTNEELSQVVLQRLVAGTHTEAINSEFPGTLFLRINDPDAEKPRRILMGTRSADGSTS